MDILTNFSTAKILFIYLRLQSAVQDLIRLYRDANFVAEITRNSANSVPDAVSWTEILHGVHNIVTSVCIFIVNY